MNGQQSGKAVLVIALELGRLVRAVGILGLVRAVEQSIRMRLRGIEGMVPVAAFLAFIGQAGGLAAGSLVQCVDILLRLGNHHLGVHGDVGLSQVHVVTLGIADETISFTKDMVR